MERTINKVEFVDGKLKPIKVAAYARVSTDKDAMLHSLAQQVAHYKELIHSHPEWIFAGVYSDEAITGTKESRSGFQEMIEDAKNGKIDLILAKSISRFARNTITLLKTIRELKNMGIAVQFEGEGINTLSSEGELLITILASYAQEESRSVSENMKWRIKKNFEEGRPWGVYLYGYKIKDGNLVIIDDEAKVIKEIFDLFLNGCGLNKITRILNDKGIRTRKGAFWSEESLKVILTNEYYTGDMILQKTFSSDHITKSKSLNNGQHPKYLVEDSHPAIISKADFNIVKSIFNSRKRGPMNNAAATPFSGKVICGCCGRIYRRKHRKYGGPTWVCTTYDKNGKSYCHNHQIREDILIESINRILETKSFDENLFNKEVIRITANNDNTLLFHLRTKGEITAHWQNKSRRESWSKEMKEKARKKALNRNKGGNDDAKDN